MSYTLVNCLGTDYAVDWSVVERLCLSYWRSHYQLVYADDRPVSDSKWYNPLSWSLPSIRSVDIDWAKVRSAAETACAKDMALYGDKARTDMRGIAYEVKYRVEQTAANRRELTTYLKDVQTLNMAEINKAVDDYTGLVQAAKFCRDTSADVVAIGSTIATGGAAAGLLGASSALKGWGKYQDTGSVGAAALYGAGSVVVGAFKVGGAKITTGGEYTLIIVQGALETGTSLVAGDTFAKSIETGGLKIASAGGAQALFGSQWAKSVFARIPLPFNVWTLKSRDGLNTLFEDEANDLVAKTTKKLTEKAIKTGYQVATAAKPAAATRTASAGLVNDVPIEQMFLLYLSIVHMTKGIGHGW